jgi:hypothetical protein
MGNRQRLVFAALVLGGVAMFVIAGLIGRSDPPDQALRTPGVEAIIPERGDEVLQQQRVAIDLEPGFVLRSMTISPNARCTDGVEVAQATFKADGLEEWSFQPAPGQPVEALSPDANCVRVQIEDITRPGTFHEVEWSFTVS